MSGVRLVRPCGLACLYALGERTERRLTVIPPVDAECRRHLSRMGFFKAFQTPGLIAPEPARGSNIVIERLDSKPGDFADRAIGVLTSQMNLSAGVAPTLATHLDEIVLNALTHARSPIGCIVCGQGFPKRGVVELAIVDLGQSIPIHLKKNPAVPRQGTDARAIEYATVEGVTGTVGANVWGEPNSGVGLSELRAYCDSGRAEMAILSGYGMVAFAAGSSPISRRFHSRFRGCLVNVRFFTA